MLNELDCLKREKRISNLAISRIQARLNDLLKKTSSVELVNLLDIELADLKVERAKFEDIQKKILPLLIEHKDDKMIEEDVESEWYAETDRLRIAIAVFSSKILTMRQNLETSNSRESILNSSVLENPESNVLKLPKIEIPTFSGDLRQWHDFQNLYRNLVHENTGLSNVQKLYYLKNAMKGNAAELIRDFTITDANYLEAWNTLGARYDNKRATIRTHLRDFFSLQKIKSEKEIRTLLDSVAKSLRSLKALGEQVDHWSAVATYWVSTRLDEKTERDWETSITDTTRFPTFKELRTFLSARASIVEDTIGCKRNEKIENKTDNKKNEMKPKSTTLLASKVQCYVCSNNHYLTDCEIFKRKTPEQRYEIIKANRLCVNCFCKKHSTSDCKGPKCKVCERKHHFLLHRNSNAETSNKTSEINAVTVKDEKVCLQMNKVSRNVILPTAVANIITDTKKILSRVVLDSCSQTNLIAESLIKRLKLPVLKNNDIIGGVGGTVFVSKFSTLIPKIASRFSNELYLENIHLDVVPYIPYSAPLTELNNLQHELKLERMAEMAFMEGKVEILLGAEFFEHCLSNQREFVEKIAVRDTIFGKVILGCSPMKELTAPPSRLCFLGVDETLRRFWELEEVDNQSVIEDEEESCLRHFESTYQRDPEGRFVIRLPFKGDCKKLSPLHNRAYSALMRLESRSEPSLKFRINEFMMEYEQLGHMVKTTEEIKRNAYYIPYQVVLRPSSVTTKVRVVFNASAKIKDHLSLNDILMKGPQLQQDIMAILVRFRERKIVFTADIKMMYRQIKINETDQEFQKILWRYSKYETIKEYKLTTLTYGTTPASFIATKCLNILAQETKIKNPKVAEIIENDFYMDDLMTGASTLKEAITIRKEVQKTLDEGCFPLRKYVSNSADLLKTIDKNLTLNVEEVNLNGEREVLVLGILWIPKTDQIQIRFNKAEEIKKVTKRSMLSELSRVFDPLGILAPATIRGKLLLQKLWRHQLAWDEPVPNELKIIFSTYRQQLSEIENFHINRRYCDHSVHKKVQLFGFADASEKAYASVVYVRCVENKDVQTYFVCAKTRVAPLREITIPKLELCGALLLAELITKLSFSLNISKDNIFCFTDSTIVLSWLNKSPDELKIFVANRTRKILKLVNFQNWSYVKSNENPADLATRGVKVKECMSKFWLQGPDWLKEVPKLKNKKINVQTDDSSLPELKKKIKASCNVILNENRIVNLANKNSSYVKLLCIIGYVLRFVNECKSRRAKKQNGQKICEIKTTNRILSSEDMNKAFVILIKNIQQTYFQKEINSLILNKNVSCKSCIFSFNPIIDEQGLLRVGGRLKNAQLSYDRTHPIIIPIKSNFAIIYLKYVHYRFFHASPTFVITFVNQKFRFIGGLKNAVKKIYHSCPNCQRYSKNSAQQIMGQLPKDRVTISRPFAIVGVDFAGPFILKPVGHRSKVRFKSYIAVFVCYCVRAVHIEVVSDQTTSAFLAVLKRFCARRGFPSTIYSDNAKNFVGAYNILVGKETKDYIAENGISWKFNPPRAPHYGGIFESAVRIMKEHMRKTIGDQTLTFEELNTLTTEIEAIMNSRPLCLKNTGEIDDYLTPGHFLTGTHLLTVPEIDQTTTKLRERWKLVENLKASFWKKWRNDYLNTFQKTFKWNVEKKNLQLGDVVFIKEDNESPSKFKLGRILKVFPGHDQKVRVVELQTKSGKLLRPITKLIPFIASTGAVC